MEKYKQVAQYTCFITQLTQIRLPSYFIVLNLPFHKKSRLLREQTHHYAAVTKPLIAAIIIDSRGNVTTITHYNTMYTIFQHHVLDPLQPSSCTPSSLVVPPVLVLALKLYDN